MVTHVQAATEGHSYIRILKIRVYLRPNEFSSR